MDAWHAREGSRPWAPWARPLLLNDRLGRSHPSDRIRVPVDDLPPVGLSSEHARASERDRHDLIASAHLRLEALELMDVRNFGCDVLGNLVEAERSSVSVVLRCPSHCVAHLRPPSLGRSERICERHVVALREQRLERCGIALRERIEGLVRLLDERIEIVRGRHGDERNGRVNVELLGASPHRSGCRAPGGMHDNEDDPTPTRCRVSSGVVCSRGLRA